MIRWTDVYKRQLHAKVVLVTGGGGSIGSELCRQIMRYRPRQLLIFDIYENCIIPRGTIILCWTEGVS